jgi:aminoglycoside phosphotransferase (APT) family kinase protein
MSLSTEEQSSLTQSLLRMGLIGEHEQPRLQPLTGGVSSMIVLAHTANGTVCVKRALAKLKVAADWQAPVERSNAEVAWIRVAETVVPQSVPEILGHDKQGLTFAMRYLDADEFPVWKASLRDGKVDAGTARAVARVLAAVHNYSADRAELAQEFANDEAFSALRLDAYFAESARRNPDCLPVISRIIDTTRATRRALVHGDVSPKNILVGKDRIILLDAETATWGDPAFDLAFCLNHLLLKCVWRPASTDGFLACYRMLHQEYLNAIRFEPAQVLEMRACALLAALLLARVDGKSPVEYITAEAEQAAVRQFAKAQLAAIPARLDAIGDAWNAFWGRRTH